MTAVQREAEEEREREQQRQEEEELRRKEEAWQQMQNEIAEPEGDPHLPSHITLPWELLCAVSLGARTSRARLPNALT